MTPLSKEEIAFYERFMELKEEAGSHSPSIHKLLEEFPQVRIEVDACFLCNPYAFDLFYGKLKDTNLEKYIKFYPPQNEEVAENISEFIKVPSDHILVGNGAIEIIEQLIGNYCKHAKVGIILPTFSTYYESATFQPVYYELSPKNNFKLDVDDYIKWLNKHKPEIVLVVNPNNPTGTLIPKEDVMRIYDSLSPNQTLVVDESFIHFTTRDESIEQEAIGRDNIVIIKSLSKDFGVAGIRLGYAINKKFKEWALKNAFLWNSNGIAYYFTTLLSDKRFRTAYTKCKNKYNKDRDSLYKELQKLPDITVYPSEANFFVIETPGKDISILFTKLFYTYGIYSRILNDKKGMGKNYLRLASKDRRENLKIINALKQILNYGK